MQDKFKKYSLVYFLTLSSLITVVAGINFFVDPGNIFGNNHYEETIAMLLVEGKNVANTNNYDQRLVQKIYINNITKPPEVVVLGASNSLEICSQNFPGRSLFNNSVSGASIEDYLAIYELYRERGFIPKIVIIGAVPWLFNKNNGLKWWTTLEEYYLSMMARLHLKPNLPESTFAGSLQEDKLAQLIDFEYLKASIDYLRRNRYPYATKEREADVSIKLADGSLSSHKVRRERSPAQTLQWP